MKNKAIQVVGTIVIVGGMIFFATGVGAQGMNGRDSMQIRQIHPKMAAGEHKEKRGLMHHIDKEDAEEIRNALENKDYETWKELVAAHEVNLPEGAKSLLEKINTKEAFEAFANKMADKGAMKEDKEEMREAIREKVEANDYEGWKVLVAEREESMENLKFSMLEKIDSVEKFDKLVKIHNLKEEVRLLNEELGLLGMGMKNGKQMGFGR